MLQNYKKNDKDQGENLTHLQRECLQEKVLLELSLEYQVAQAKTALGLGNKEALYTEESRAQVWKGMNIGDNLGELKKRDTRYGQKITFSLGHEKVKVDSLLPGWSENHLTAFLIEKLMLLAPSNPVMGKSLDFLH